MTAAGGPATGHMARKPAESGQGAEDRRRFERDGFVVIRRALTPDRLSRLRRIVERLIADAVDRRPDTDRFFLLPDKPATLYRLPRIDRCDPVLRAELETGWMSRVALHLMNETVVPQWLQVLNKPARSASATPPHQDAAYYAIRPLRALSLWIALDRADPANGCLRYWPGSQVGGLLPHEQSSAPGFDLAADLSANPGLSPEIAVPLEPGDALAHDCLTLHAAGGNNSDRSRFALNALYYAARVEPDPGREACLMALRAAAAAGPA